LGAIIARTFVRGRLLMSAPLEIEDLAERNRTPMRDAGL
jgi:hypothetical protein